MAEPPKQNALQRWGSKDLSTGGKLRLLLGVALVVGLLFGGGIYVGTRETDDRLERQQVLDLRYVEEIEIATVNTGSQPEVIQVDGEPRDDCEETDDGYLECSEDPQPTLDPAAAPRD